jgi:peptide/nickel transport system substrate-binding protein
LAFGSPPGFAYCNTRLDQVTQAAQAAGTNAPRRAATLWAAADRLVVDDAALLPLVNTRQLDFVSARIQNFQHHPYWDVIVDQFWLR